MKRKYFKDKRVRTHAFFISLMIAPFILYLLYIGVYVRLVGPSTEGVHVMANGEVMNKFGQILTDAKVMPDGTVVSKYGKTIGSKYLGTRFTSTIDGLPDAKITPDVVSLHDGDTFALSASYVKKVIGTSTLRMLAYNGSIPGPEIDVDQGATITINFTNNTEMPQTLHSHGVRIDNQYDGVANYTQDAVLPGQTFSYKVHFKDAGVYWYHPHVREDYSQALGLYGNYIVKPADQNYWSAVNRELPLVLSDILVNNGQISPYYKELTNFALMGRYGNHMLVNGEENYKLAVKAGEVIRFYVTDTASVRTFNLSIPNAKLKLVGADLGKYEHETFVDSLLLSPGERLVVEAYFPHDGTYTLLHTTPNGIATLATIEATGTTETSYVAGFNELRTNGDVMNELESLQKYFYAAPDKKLLLTVAVTGVKIDHSKHVHVLPLQDGTVPTGLPNLQWDDPGQSDMTDTNQHITWEIIDEKTQKINMNINDWTFTQGQLVKVQIKNDPFAEHVMQHPIHFHGQRFVVLDTNGVRNTNLVWKDTVLVGPGETVDILVDMSNPGTWMAHCHISEHLNAGMMFNFSVLNADGSKYQTNYIPHMNMATTTR